MRTPPSDLSPPSHPPTNAAATSSSSSAPQTPHRPAHPWLYPHPLPQSSNPAAIPRSLAPPSPSSTMIGPTPTFYDPDHALPPQSDGAYEHWIQSHQQQQHPQNQFGFAHYPPPQPPPQQTQQQHRIPPSMQPLHNQYQFVNTNPNPNPSLTPATADPSPFSYFNPDSLPPTRFVNSHPHSPTTTRTRQPQSTTTTAPAPAPYDAPDFGAFYPAQPPYMAEGAYGERLTPSASYSATTPLSDAQTLPSHGSSLSPSWHDERQLPPSYPAPAPAMAFHTPSQIQTSPGAGKRGGAGKGGSAKAARGRKRTKKDAAEDSESEDFEDEGGMGGGGGEPQMGLPQRLKREYLLAQIRQKDGIIESLLKQLHNPYLATPLSIAAYRMATSSSDNHRQNVVAWLDRLQTSVRHPARGRADLQAFHLASAVGAGGRAREREEEEEEAGEAEAEGVRMRGGMRERENENEDEEEEDADADAEGGPMSAGTLVDPDADDPEDERAYSAALPDAAVPLGLLADLAITAEEKGKSRGFAGLFCPP
ncbi:hypothetical protein OF83DRAFT_1180235 [Amylostereum chailletii]|nr:hypothetical protein OF83DRAFT_1180235 [Amylostereum chailletii]